MLKLVLNDSEEFVLPERATISIDQDIETHLQYLKLGIQSANYEERKVFHRINSSVNCIKENGILGVKVYYVGEDGDTLMFDNVDMGMEFHEMYLRDGDLSDQAITGPLLNVMLYIEFLYNGDNCK